ncbi:MAG TPA: transposase [Saprospiraceae bacterium]|nr:transposase [Saprospiraceae bacterium]
MIDKLIKLVRKGFKKVSDSRRNNLSYELVDLLSIGFAMFSLKDSSLSSFKEQYSVRAQNLLRIYGIKSLPGDTAFRESLDEVRPEELQSQFKAPLDLLRKEGVMKRRKVLGKYTVVTVDGTGHYCSGKKDCPQCMVKNHRNGKQTFYHQLLGAVAVHPQQSTVFPIACEAIVKQDGSTKNDCELNASKRIIPQIRQTLPKEEIITVFDALYANGPHIKALSANNMRYIIGTKGKTYVDVQVQELRKKDKLERFQWETQTTICLAYFTNGLILNGEHQDIITNYFECTEVDKQTGEQVFFSTWITDITVTSKNIMELASVARSRWKIENETFNTLKNQGYHLEHNYGHGKKYLATNFAILTFLAFLVDQIAQQLDKDFQKAKEVCKSFKAFWEKVRYVFYLLPAMSMNAIYRFIIKRRQVNMPPLE